MWYLYFISGIYRSLTRIQVMRGNANADCWIQQIRGYLMECRVKYRRALTRIKGVVIL